MENQTRTVVTELFQITDAVTEDCTMIEVQERVPFLKFFKRWKTVSTVTLKGHDNGRVAVNIEECTHVLDCDGDVLQVSSFTASSINQGNGFTSELAAKREKWIRHNKQQIRIARSNK